MLMLDPVVCNVSITSPHSDLHGVDHKYNENTKGSRRMCGGRPGSDTPFTLLQDSELIVNAIGEKQNCPTELPLSRH